MVKTITGYDNLYETPYEMLIDFSFSSIGKDAHEILYVVNELHLLGYRDLVNHPYQSLCIDTVCMLNVRWQKFSIGLFIDKEKRAAFIL